MSAIRCTQFCITENKLGTAVRTVMDAETPDETPDETIESWSAAIAYLVVDALVDCGFVKKEEIDGAVEVVTEEIWVRLRIGDYPPPAPPNP